MGLALLLSSKAFIDYSTSGLENPLSHLLLALFYLHYFRSDDDTRGLRYSALFAAFLVLNRMDLLLMVAPPLMLRARRVGWKSAIPGLLLGFVPLISWLLFSLIYYGFPFPNTAYAKLSTGISRFALIDQGLAYFVAFLRMDWLGLPIILASVGCALIARDHRLRAAGIALLLYLLYLLSIGGDFMNGRFFAAPLLVGVLLVVQRFAELRPQVAVGVAVGALALALINPYSSLRSGADYGSDWAAHPEKYRDALTHIADERGFYYPTAGLLLAGSERYWPSHQYVKEALEIRWQDRRQLVIWDSTGYRGYFAGPQVFILDRLALTDPLLSKLPAYIQKDFYIGHFARLIPPGYVESLTQKQNRIEDEGLAKFYDDIRLITRGPLFASGRWAAIWRTNLGLNRKWYAAYARSAQLGEES
jgi:arabinofuranosyltransferase